MTRNEFKMFALHELANHDARALAQALQGRSGPMRAGIDEVLRLMKAQKAFPDMGLTEMWATDAALSGTQKRGRRSTPDVQKAMLDPAWTAVNDLERLKALWREVHPTKQVPLEYLTDIAVEYRGADRSAVEARRSRPKSRRMTED